MKSYDGFTLVELLVVVLIIGILAAIAMPNYQKAVTKSRAAEMLSLTKSLAQAEELYYLVNESYANTFNDLPVTFETLPKTTFPNPGWIIDQGRANDYMALMMSFSGGYNRSISQFIKGQYKGSGFIWMHKPLGSVPGKQMYCAEPDSAVYSVEPGFCNKVMGITSTPVKQNNALYYAM